VQRSLTLDIDLADVLRRPGSKSAFDEDRIWLPVAIIEKQPLLDLDVRDESGSALAVAVSDEDSHAAHAMMLARVTRHGLSRHLTPEVQKDLFQFARRRSFSTLVQALEIAFPEENTAGTVPTIPRTFEGDPADWRELLDNGEVLETVHQLSMHYILMVAVKRQGPRPIVKFRYVQPAVLQRPLAPGRLGLASTGVLIEAPGIGQGQREHTRVVAPDGATLDDLQLLADGQPVNTDTYDRRVGFERALAYTSGLPPAHYEIEVKLNPRRGTFLGPSLITILFTFALLVFAFYLEDFDGRLTGGLQTDPGIQKDAAVTVLALLPSLVSIYLVRPGEHDLVARLLRAPRALVVLAALSTVLAGASVAADVTHASLMTVLSIALLCNGVATVVLTIAVIRISWARRDRAV
jgi:hypothetical protein